MKLIIISLLSFSFSAQSITFKAWQKLTNEEKIEYLDYESADVSIDINSQKMNSSNLPAAKLNKVKPKMSTLISSLHSYQTELYTEVEDDYHATVGELSKTADLYFSEDLVFLGANIRYFQQGCSHFDSSNNYLEESGHYATIDEARKNNCIDNDVSWSANSIVNENVSEIYNSEYMEWSGH